MAREGRGRRDRPGDGRRRDDRGRGGREGERRERRVPTERPDRSGGEEHKAGPERERVDARRHDRTRTPGGTRARGGDTGRRPAGESSGGWIWIVVILIVIAVIAYFVFFR